MVEKTGGQIRSLRIAKDSVRRHFMSRFSQIVLSGAMKAPWGQRGARIEEIAELVGAHERTVLRWLRGESSPAPRVMAVLLADRGHPSLIMPADWQKAKNDVERFLSTAGLTEAQRQRAKDWTEENYLKPMWELGLELQRLGKESVNVQKRPERRWARREE